MQTPCTVDKDANFNSILEGPEVSIVAEVQGVEKTVISKMLEEGSNRWTYPVDRHAGVVRLHLHSLMLLKWLAPLAVCNLYFHPHDTDSHWTRRTFWTRANRVCV
jgi:hypothetical protein